MNRKMFAQAIDTSYALKPKRQTGRAFHVTFIYLKNKVISIGVNNYNAPHPYLKFGRYESTKGNNQTYESGLHSELSGILKLGVEDCSDFDFLNIRIDNNDLIKLAKPCVNCLRTFEMVGYRKIYYTNNKGELETLKI